ncbi:MAG: RNA-binding S4 domain-containing protein [Verrucomicrobiota bacterium]
MESAVPTVRVDKWLWSVRFYKSRSLATDACANGKVRVNGQPAKASRFVKAGDIVTAQTGEILRTAKVISPLEKRVGAKLVSQFFEDLTPQSEYEKPKEKYFQPYAFRPKGSGRPTKKDRRNIEGFLP